MKISQKLTLGFLGTCFLFGGLGASHLKRNTEIEYWTNQVVGVISEEAKTATYLSRSLHSIQTYSEEILILEKDWKSSQNKIAKERELIQIELDNFARDIKSARDASSKQMEMIKAGNNNIDKEVEIAGELEDLETVQKIEEAFASYQKNLNIFLNEIADNDSAEAQLIFDTKLNKQFREELIPLIRKYQEYALTEIKDSEEDIENKLKQSHRDILISTVFASIFFAGLYLYIYRSTYPPLKKLKDAALEIGNGKLNTKIIPIDSDDELGILAKSFNKMTEGLKQTTVSNHYLDNILTSMADSLIVVNTNLRIAKVNQTTLNLLGYSEEELIGKKIDLIITDDLGLNINFLIESDRFPFNCELIYQTKDNQRIPIEFSSNKIVNEEGVIEAVVCLGKNITARKKAEKALKESEKRYSLAANAVDEGLWDWNLQTNLVYFSERWKAILGYSENEIENQIERWFSLVHPNSRETFKYKVANHLKKNNNSQFEMTYQMRHKNGSYRWILCRAIVVKDDRGKKIERLTGAITDITERKIREEKLHYKALHDTLTGLPNRTFFTQKLKQLIDPNRQVNNKLFAVMYLDLDCFQAINDSVGYLGGDTLLMEIGKRLKSSLRNATIVRLRGDKFGIILEKLKLAQNATEIAEKLIEDLTIPFKIEKRQVFINPIVAIALSTKYYSQVEDILQDVDTALYCFKTSGKKIGYSIYQPAMQISLLKRRELERDLPRAIQQNQFKIFYQPIIKLTSNKIIGFEALMRWQHPEKGLISAAEFMSLARETGALISISWSILKDACAQMVNWQKQYSLEKDMFISVNVSALQFFQTDFIAKIHQILQETTLKPSRLQLEITEKVIRQDSEAAKSILEQLKSLGIKIAIDNFSHEDSSLSYVSNLPIDRLKIDRSFFRNININRKRFKVMRSIVNLSLELGIEPIASEIETEEELSKLQELKCEYVQGYLFSRPLNQKSASALISEKYDRARTSVE